MQIVWIQSVFVFHKYHLEGIVDFKNNVIPRAVSEHKFSSWCELGVPKRADVARLGWE
jgi:hypothetical protein